MKFKNQSREPKFRFQVYQRPVKIFKLQSRSQTQVRDLQHPPKPQMRTWMFFAHSKSRQRVKIWIMSVSKTSDHLPIKMKVPNPSQKPPASFKTPNQDLKEMAVLCLLKIKIDSQNIENGCIKYQ